MRKTLEGCVSVYFYIFLFVNPFIFSSESQYISFELVLQCGILILCLLSLYRLFLSKEVLIHYQIKKTLFKIIILFAVYMSFVFWQGFGGHSALMSNRIGSADPYATFKNAERSLYYFIFFVSAVLFINNRSQIRSIFTIIQAQVIILACVGFYQSIQNKIFITNKWIYGIKQPQDSSVLLNSTFVNENHYAMYLVLAVFLSASTTVYDLRQIIRAPNSKQILAVTMAFLTIPIGFMACVYSHARGPLLFGAALLLLLIVSIVKKMGKFVWLAISILLILFILCMSLVSYVDVYTQLADLIEKGYSGRVNIYKDAWNIFSKYEWFGTGLGSFGCVINLFENISTNARTFHYLHNDPYQHLIEVGIVGFLLFAAMFVLFFADCYKGFRRNPSNFCKSSGFCLLLTIGCFLIATNYDFYLRIPSIAFLFLLGLAVIFRVSCLHEYRNGLMPQRKEVQIFGLFKLMFIRKWILIVGATMLIAVLFAHSFYNFKLHRDVFQKRGLNNMREAVVKSKHNPLAWHEMAKVYATKVATSSDSKDMVDAYKKSEEAYFKAIELSPFKATYWIDLARLYALRGKVKEALLAYEEAIVRAPNKTDLYANIIYYYGLASKKTKRLGEREYFDNKARYWARNGSKLPKPLHVNQRVSRNFPTLTDNLDKNLSVTKPSEVLREYIEAVKSFD